MRFGRPRTVGRLGVRTLGVLTESPSKARQAAERVVARLQAGGHIAYFAGGCVRDELLGLHPSDYDVATDARPEQVRRLFRRTSVVGAVFGVVLVRDFGTTVEVATFRSDGPYSDKRRPDSVTFADARLDAARRDFTINALFLDPLAPPEAGQPPVSGKVIDYVAGLPDLRAGIVRAVGAPEERLAEDHLRALRAVRFAARLGFAIEAGTFEAMRAHASELAGISRERIGEEMRRMLRHPSRVRAVELLVEAGLDGPVFQEPTLDRPTPVLASLPPEAEFALCLAAMMVDRHGLEGATDTVVRRWRSALMLSNEERDNLAGAVALARAIAEGWEKAGVAQQKRWAAHRLFKWCFFLLSQRQALLQRIEGDVQALARSWGGMQPEPLLTGNDLIARGFQPGPGFGGLLASVYDAQLEGRVRSSGEALALARELAGRWSVQIHEHG